MIIDVEAVPVRVPQTPPVLMVSDGWPIAAEAQHKPFLQVKAA